MKKLILFGAGQNGKRALDFWGEDKVECFADNDEKKRNKLYFGKKVISLEQLSLIWRDYEVMITANSFGEIAEQLKAAGIPEYTKFMVPNTNKALSYIKKICWEKYSKIAVYGSDEYTVALLRNMPEEIKNKVSCIIDNENEMENREIQAVLISSPKFHIAVESRLLKKFSDKIDILNPYRMQTYYSTEELVINKYINNGSEFRSEEEIKEKNRNRSDYFEAVKEYVQTVRDEPSLFRLVEIETINRCNGSCEFCPVNRNDDPREKHIMTEDLFFSIINQLEEMRYKGRISLFSNNEPFLDERILQFSKYMREHLPHARIHMFTNGTLLTKDKFIELIPFLDELIIDNYTQDLHLIKPAREIRDYCLENPDLIKKVSIVLRKPKELLSTRGSAAPNREARFGYPDVTCALPFQQLIIRPTGEVSLCCNDALGKYTLGDLTKESIMDVWYGQKFGEMRRAIADGRKNIEICKYCDVFSLYL